MKYFKFLLLVLCCIKSLPTNAEKNFKANIAIVDVQSILEHSLAMQSIRKSIDSISQNIQNDISKKESQLKKIEEELIKKRSTLGEETFEKEVNEFNKKVSEAQKYIQDRKTHLEQAHAEAVSALHNATIGIISDIAKKNNLNIVLPSSQVLFAKNDLNITPEVIQQLNTTLKYIKVNYK
jgi:Skp family chaperone for outer membrane proteins